jgi:hypothetical protein
MQRAADRIPGEALMRASDPAARIKELSVA